MEEDNSHKPPGPSRDDAAHAIGRGLLSLIPYLGGPAVELFSALVTPPLERRRQEWMEKIGAALQDLHEVAQIDIDALARDEGFIDTLLVASQAAMRTSQEEKLESLKNAVLHTALPDPPDQALRQIFLSLVDEFTEWHLRLLKLFQDPRAWAESRGHTFSSVNSLTGILESAYPELQGERAFYDLVFGGLVTRGLTNTGSLQGMITPQGTLESRLTEIGNQFLAFIDSPASQE
jgi:hypothetical protein